MAERDVRHVAVEFRGGPLDGWSSGVMTDEAMLLPEFLRSDRGRYTLSVPTPARTHFLYEWTEGA